MGSDSGLNTATSDIAESLLDVGGSPEAGEVLKMIVYPFNAKHTLPMLQPIKALLIFSACLAAHRNKPLEEDLSPAQIICSSKGMVLFWAPLNLWTQQSAQVIPAKTVTLMQVVVCKNSNMGIFLFPSAQQ